MNMQSLMAQAQRMQKEITKKQEEIYETTYTGNSEWVEVKVKGSKKIEKIDIKYTGDLNEDKDMLADMLMLALNDAYKKIEVDIEKKLGSYSKQLGGLM